MLLHSRECGGAETHALGLMSGLRREGHHVTYCGRTDSWLMKQAETRGIPVLHTRMRGTYDLVSLVRMVAYARKRRIDVIHGHLARGAFYARWVGKLSGKPSLVTAHATNTFKFMNGTDWIIAVSHAVRSSLAERGIGRDKTSVVFNGIPATPPRDGTHRAEMRRALGIGDSETAVCMVARFVQAKGHDVMVEALRILDEPRPRLIFIGRTGGDCFDRVSQLVHRYGLEPRVTFLGHRDDVMDILQAMDLFAAPSRREALGLSILEALAADLPVVASDIGGIPEIVKDGETGLLVPPNEPHALAGAISRVMHDASLASSLRRAGRELLDAKFSQDAMVRNTVAVYHRLIAATNGR